LIIFIEKKSHSAQDTLTHFKEDLLIKLPLESDRFLAKLEKAILLPHGTGSMIRAEATREKKVSYYLEYVVSSGPDTYLPELFGIMEKEDDNLVLIKLARDMKNYIG